MHERDGQAAASDEELVARSRGGDDRAFGELVRRYEARVAATVIGILGPGTEAEDVGQETFIRFHRALARYRGDAAVGTYLTRIAMNLSLTAARRRRRWFDRFKGPEHEIDAAPAGGDPEAEYETERNRRRVHAALGSLSPEHRAVIVLRWIDGRSTRETAELLGIPQGTVMSRLTRAMARLEQRLTEDAT